MRDVENKVRRAGISFGLRDVSDRECRRGGRLATAAGRNAIDDVIRRRYAAAAAGDEAEADARVGAQRAVVR